MVYDVGGKEMKKILSMGVVAMLVVLLLTACGGGQTYEDVLKEYTDKIEQAAPTLVEEFRTESSGITDITKLAEISIAKIQKLAEISTEGIGKMAEIRLKNNDGNGLYEDWAKKLTDVYEREAKKITDEYDKVANNAINSLLP